MKISLVCIAKNEDNYIQEWINYHLKLGFDNIFIYENDWDSKIENHKVTKYPVVGVKQQIPVYNEFISKHKNSYDWAAFLDVDEFLVLKKHKTIHEFIEDYKDNDSIGVNWVLFGDNNLTKSDDYGMINRFTMRQNSPNHHIKSIINLKNAGYMSVHNHSGKCVDTNYKRIDNSPFNYNGPIDVAQINHYFCKTKDEFIEKLNRGRADNGTHRDISDFNDNNFNEIEDLTAMNFLYDNNNLLNT
jgi:hypothetical protein